MHPEEVHQVETSYTRAKAREHIRRLASVGKENCTQEAWDGLQTLLSEGHPRED